MRVADFRSAVVRVAEVSGVDVTTANSLAAGIFRSASDSSGPSLGELNNQLLFVRLRRSGDPLRFFDRIENNVNRQPSY